jgi:hypothetical protein
MELKMENNPQQINTDYEKVNPEEILIKLKEILAFIQKMKLEGKI